MLNFEAGIAKKIEDIYTLSPMQTGMLFHSLLDADAKEGVYHQQLLWDVEGWLDIVRFTKAWEKIVLSHSILRTGFFWKNLEKPLQVVFQQLSIQIRLEDISNLSPEEQHEFLEKFLEQDKDNPFSLESPPLMRLVLFQRKEDSYTFLWSHHHIILDGWSIAIILEQVMNVYEKMINDLPCPLRLTSGPPFLEYIKWLQKQELAEAEAFWKNELKGFHAPASCQEILNRMSKSECREEEIIISEDLVQNLRTLANRQRWTFATLLQGAWALVQSRYCTVSDVVFGFTLSGRPSQLINADSMVGLFINTLPLRVKITGNLIFKDWMNEIQKKQHQLKDWEYVSLVDIQRWSEMPKGQPLFESIFVFENYPVSNQLSQASLRVLNGRAIETTNYPLTLSAGLIDSNRLSLKLKYDQRFYSFSLIESMLDYMKTLLINFPHASENSLNQLPSFGAQQDKKLKQISQGSKWPFPELPSLSIAFEKYAFETPDAIALIEDDQSYSYAEINHRANQIAYYLRSKGARKETIVAIGLKRSLVAVVTILATWKVGAAYLPLDLSLPLERLLKILALSLPVCLIVQGEIPEHLNLINNHVEIFDLEKEKNAYLNSPGYNLTERFLKHQLAYIIFTSGSTGVPKAVMVEHQSLMNIAQGWKNEYALDQMDIRLLQVANFSFDVFIGDLARCFFNGGMMVICPDSKRLEPAAFYSLLAQHRITIFESTPGLILPLMEYIYYHKLALENLRILVLGSDYLRREDYFLLRKRLGPWTRILNSYGITEATIDTSYFEEKNYESIDKEIEKSIQAFASPYVSIGYPFANMGFYVLDESLTIQPIGVKGEIYISGDGLARGYYADPILTAEKFIPNPFEIGQRMYKTGDFGRWLYEGGMEILGRSDDQVKIRGYRISLAEVSRAIETFPTITQCVVMATEQGKNILLVSYYTSKEFVDETTLRFHLSQILPSYMIPAYFIFLESFPLSPNGKIDRKSLAMPQISQAQPFSERNSKTEVEEIIHHIWKEILNLEEIDIHISFFELGGNSILILKLFNKIDQHFASEISIVDLFTYHTISQLASFISKKKSELHVKSLDQIMEDLQNQRITAQEAQSQMELI